MNHFVKIALLAISFYGSTAAMAQEELTESERAQEAVETRQGLFKLLAWNMDPLGAMARNRIPFDAEMAQQSAARIEFLAAMIGDVLQRDTRDFDVSTQARDGIWSNMDDIAAKADALATAAADLNTAAASGDQTAVRRAIIGVGQACGSCHDAYRDEDE